ncbi:MAG: hypothetical protein RR475_02400 [Clostridia bacterium]
MIEKIGEKKNGFVLNMESTKEDFKDLVQQFPKPVRCIICNNATSKWFRTPILRNNIITVNNRLRDGEFYFNSIN